MENNRFWFDKLKKYQANTELIETEPHRRKESYGVYQRIFELV